MSRERSVSSCRRQLIAVRRIPVGLGAARAQQARPPWNTASLRSAERAGYDREGLLRSHTEIGARRRDMVLLAVVRPAAA